MAIKTLTTRVKNKYDSASRWKNINPVLLEGEFGVDEYGRVKAGDGVTRWNSLPYVMDAFRLEPLYSSDYQDGAISISPLSDQVIYVQGEGNVNLTFEKVYKNGEIDKLYFTQKRIYIENTISTPITLTVSNAEWANDNIAPVWGDPDMHIYILATWIGGRIILEVIDNDQLADNVVSS